VDLTFDRPGAQLAVTTNHVSGVVSLAELGLEDAVLDAGGLERQIVVRRLPDHLARHSMDETLELDGIGSGDAALWVRVTTLDGHQAWSSPIYLHAG
jgi:hypothetical protein